VAVDPGFERLFRDEFAGIARTVYLICHDHHRAEEIAQDAFVQALRHWDKVGGLDRPGAWVRKVAVRLAVKAVRRESRRRAAERLVPVSAVARGTESRDAALMAAVRSLPPQQRAAVVLYYLEDRPLAEIAEILGCADATARVHVHRARARLAEALTGEEVDRVDD
jgi:RNA polymerase sigma-70 factor (ECF subfamily)